MDLQTLKKLFPNASESTIRANVGPVAGLQGAEPEPNQRSQSEDCRVEESPSRVVFCVHIFIISIRRRILDEDNYIAGCKPLRDSIANSLGCDDADMRLRWQYHQLKTDGPEGTIVAISIE